MAKISTVIRGFEQLENKNIVVLNKDQQIVQIFQPQDDVFKTLQNDKLFIYRTGATQFLTIFVGDGKKDFNFKLFGQPAETLNLNTEELYLKLMTDFFFRNVGAAGESNFLGAAATDPAGSSNGQTYYNTVLNTTFQYNETLGKWLSIETYTAIFNRRNRLSRGTFLKVGEVLTSLQTGILPPNPARAISAAWNRTDAASTELVLNGGGASRIISIPAGQTSGTQNLNLEFSDILTLQNSQFTGNSITNPIVSIFYKLQGIP